MLTVKSNLTSIVCGTRALGIERGEPCLVPATPVYEALWGIWSSGSPTWEEHGPLRMTLPTEWEGPGPVM